MYHSQAVEIKGFLMKEAKICLVGVWRVLAAGKSVGDAVEAFYSEVIPRLLGEVDCGGRLSRLVGFRAIMGRDRLWQFLGVEVGCLKEIPDGMTGLMLGESFGEVFGAGGAKERFPLDWTWLDKSGAFPVGEFEAAIPHCVPQLCPFSITTNAYVGGAGALSAEDAIELVEYDVSWPEKFKEMAGWLRGMLPAGATRVAHYGSTSVPGMPAKPVIDMLVETPSFDEAHRCLLPALNCDCWEYWWYSDHMIFIKRLRLNGPRTHHVHVAPPGHRLWEGLAFRDYLVSHPETACAYAALKHELAVRFRTERERYTEAKTAFIRMVTDEALFRGD